MNKSMTKPNTQVPPSENRLLALLPPKDRARLESHLEPIHLRKGKTLYHIGDQITDVYFPVEGMISLLSTTRDGAAVEVGMVGNEGMAGLTTILGAKELEYQMMVQIAGEGFRLKANLLQKEFDRTAALRNLLLRYTHVVVTQLSQSAVCNRFHTIEERMCRWLLIARDRVQSDTLEFTQEILSHMLGAPRTLVTMTAGRLQEAGLIMYKRGSITLLRREQMEDAACECYQIIRRAFDRFLAG